MTFQLENLSSYLPSSNFSYSFTSKRVMDMYEEGQLIANADLCPNSGENLKLMILVTSAPNHHDARMAIRQTWGFYCRHHNVGFGFLVGASIQPSQNDVIQIEQRTYGDLIQTRNVDFYGNLTRKTVSLLEWVDTHCSQVPFVLKTDDDVFINIPRLLALLEKQQQAKRSIFGLPVRKKSPYRTVGFKYSVNKSEYEPDMYPNYLNGPAYLMTQDSVHDLYRQALNMPFLKMEDVFLTGLVARSLGIRIVDVPKFMSFDHKIPFDIPKMREIISIHSINPSEQFLIWAYMRPRSLRTLLEY
ncbi:hypothetical protein V9T40_002771 [Parthenolecanium corni]|uniref:Hexosyltransferase n=1 Tax=Parthenolecanium corni TaxID=536013 RepID=A0AAN9TLC7_9HEMI